MFIVNENIKKFSSIIWMESPEVHLSLIKILHPNKNNLPEPVNTFPGIQAISVLTAEVIRRNEIRKWFQYKKLFTFDKKYLDKDPDIKEWLKNNYPKITFKIFCNLRKILDFTSFFYKDNCNQLQMPFGIALYENASKLNHSCCPNAFVFFIQEKICVIALKDILKGQEITISMTNSIDHISNFYDRRRFILKELNFMCDCYECKNNIVRKNLIIYKPYPEKLEEALLKLNNLTKKEYFSKINVVVFAFENEFLNQPIRARNIFFNILIHSFKFNINNQEFINKCVILFNNAC